MAVTDRDPLEEAWEALQSSWDDDQQHRRFLELSRLAGDLQGAGLRYRKVREHDPERAEMAARQIDRLLGLAMQELQVLRTPARKPSRIWLWLATAITASAAMVVLSLLLRSR